MWTRAYDYVPEFVGSKVGDREADPNTFTRGGAPPTRGSRCDFYRPDYQGKKGGREMPEHEKVFGDRASENPPGATWLDMFCTFPPPVALARMRAPLLLPDMSSAPLSHYSSPHEPTMLRIYEEGRFRMIKPGARIPETQRMLDGSPSFSTLFEGENEKIALFAFKAISYILRYSHGSIAILSGRTTQEDAWSYITTGAAWTWVGTLDHLAKFLTWTTTTRNYVLPRPDRRHDWPDLSNIEVVKDYILHVCANITAYSPRQTRGDGRFNSAKFGGRAGEHFNTEEVWFVLDGKGRECIAKCPPDRFEGGGRAHSSNTEGTDHRYRHRDQDRRRVERPEWDTR